MFANNMIAANPDNAELKLILIQLIGSAEVYLRTVIGENSEI